MSGRCAWFAAIVLAAAALTSGACGDDAPAPAPASSATAQPATTVPATPAPTRVTTPSAVAPVLQSPAQVVASFYGWYLDYARTRNPLVDHAYRGRPELTSTLIAALDRATSGQLMFDPVLCAQNVPEKVTPGAAMISGDGMVVAMTSSFEGHRWSVYLARGAGSWLIAEVRCSP